MSGSKKDLREKTKTANHGVCLSVIYFLRLICTTAKLFVIPVAILHSSLLAASIDSMSVRQVGNSDGNTVVFIPGLASSEELWSPWVEKLSATHDIRIVQVLGFAGSQSKGKVDPIINSVTSDLAQHLTTVRGKNTVVVGHSIGGLIAMKLAYGNKTLVDKLLIVDSLPFLAELFLPGKTPQQAAIQAQVMASHMKSLPRHIYDAQQRASIIRLSKTPDFLPTLIAWSEASDHEVVATALGEALATDFRSQLAEISQPVRVLVPWDYTMPFNKEQTLALYRAQYQSLPNGSLVAVENSYHFLMVDQPDIFHHHLKTVVDETEK